MRVHIKNNHWSAATFPNTPEGEAVFSITRDGYEAAARRHADVAERIEAFIDWNTEHFVESMKTADALICWDLPTQKLAAVAPQLKWIHIIGAGVEHLMPMDWLPPDVVLTNNKGVHAMKAGEYGLMAILMLNAWMPALFTQQRQAQYKSLYATPLAGKTVGIVGVGNIGGAVADHLKRLGMRVLGVRRHGEPHPSVERMFTAAQLDDVLPQADFLFVSTPLTRETRHLIDRRRLGLMKRGAGIANVGRAAVVDYAALAEALGDGRISGAILDVFDPEPLPAGSPLWAMPNVIVTPHVSSDDEISYVPLTLDLFFDNARRYLAGEPLRNRVRPELGY